MKKLLLMFLAAASLTNCADLKIDLTSSPKRTASTLFWQSLISANSYGFYRLINRESLALPAALFAVSQCIFFYNQAEPAINRAKKFLRNKDYAITAETTINSMQTVSDIPLYSAYDYITRLSREAFEHKRALIDTSNRYIEFKSACEGSIEKLQDIQDYLNAEAIKITKMEGWQAQLQCHYNRELQRIHTEIQLANLRQSLNSRRHETNIYIY